MKASVSIYVWDKDDTIDRYTIAIEYPGHSIIDIYGCSTMPFHPQGIAQFSHSMDRLDFTCKNTKHFGKILNYTALCPDVQQYIRQLINFNE